MLTSVIKIFAVVALVLATALTIKPAFAQEKGERSVDQYTCKDVMRESGPSRDVAITAGAAKAQDSIRRRLRNMLSSHVCQSWFDSLRLWNGTILDLSKCPGRSRGLVYLHSRPMARFGTTGAVECR